MLVRFATNTYHACYVGQCESALMYVRDYVGARVSAFEGASVCVHVDGCVCQHNLCVRGTKCVRNEDAHITASPIFN